MTLFDAYELRARLAPALIVVSPFLLVAGAVIPAVSASILGSSVWVLILLVLLYLLSFLVRGLGRRIEPGLWRSWGGPPSTLVLTDQDGTFTAQTKQEICQALSAVLGINGAALPAWAQSQESVHAAFGKVRQFIRAHDPSGLWDRHNAEYGFLRNLMGAWWLWLLNAGLAALACGALWYTKGSRLAASFAVCAMGFAAAALFARTCILPKAVRLAALRYAESAWLSFLTCATVGKARPGREGEP